MLDAEHARSFTFDKLRTTITSQPADKPVVVDFWAPRCASCRAILATIDDLARRFNGHGVVGTFNVQENPEAVRSLGIETVPTLFVFRNGDVESVLVGAEKIQTFVERIDEEVFAGTRPVHKNGTH